MDRRSETNESRKNEQTLQAVSLFTLEQRDDWTKYFSLMSLLDPSSDFRDYLMASFSERESRGGTRVLRDNARA